MMRLIEDINSHVARVNEASWIDDLRDAFNISALSPTHNERASWATNNGRRRPGGWLSFARNPEPVALGGATDLDAGQITSDPARHRDAATGSPMPTLQDFRESRARVDAASAIGGSGDMGLFRARTWTYWVQFTWIHRAFPPAKLRNLRLPKRLR